MSRHRKPQEAITDHAYYRRLSPGQYQAMLARHRADKRRRRIDKSRDLWADARMIVNALHERGISDHAIRARTGIPHPYLRRVFRPMEDHEHIRHQTVRKLADLLVDVIDTQAPKLHRGRPGRPTAMLRTIKEHSR